MRWVTTERVHLDRVASAWLILRFIDPQAEFEFVPRENISTVPTDAIAFAIPGAEIKPHGVDGPTFGRLIAKYALQEPALGMLTNIVSTGINHALKREAINVPDPLESEGVGLAIFSQGMMLLKLSDRENIRLSMATYDSLLAYCKSKLNE